MSTAVMTNCFLCSISKEKRVLGAAVGASILAHIALFFVLSFTFQKQDKSTRRFHVIDIGTMTVTVQKPKHKTVSNQKGAANEKAKPGVQKDS